MCACAPCISLAILPTAPPACPTLPADILQLVGLKSFRVAGVLLLGLLAYGEWRCCPWHIPEVLLLQPVLALALHIRKTGA